MLKAENIHIEVWKSDHNRRESHNERVSTANGIADVIREMKNGVKFEDAVDKHYSYNLAKALGGKEIIKATKEPIHYIDIPQSLKDKAMSKGFPLFSSTHMFTPISGDPFNDKK